MQPHQLSTRNQSGFSVLEGLLIALVVAALVVIGLMVYQRHKSISTKSIATTNTTKTTTKPAQTTTQYLTIKEWGVKLPLSSTISDAFYVVPNDSSPNADGKPSDIQLGLTSLNNSCGTATPDSAGYSNSLAFIIRTLPTATDPVSGKLYTQLDPNGTTIGSYYYGYADAYLKAKTCISQTSIQSIDSAFATAAKGMVAAIDPNYLVIKEWGIKIKLADADKVTYTLGGNPNSSSANADGIVSWATLKLNSSVNTSDKCRLLGFEAEQLTAGTDVAKIGKYDYGFNGSSDPCGDSTVDPLRAKITGSELVTSAITAE